MKAPYCSGTNPAVILTELSINVPPHSSRKILWAVSMQKFNARGNRGIVRIGDITIATITIRLSVEGRYPGAS